MKYMPTEAANLIITINFAKDNLLKKKAKS